MHSICFFASYFESNDLPYYVTVYLKELKNHFTKVVFLTSQKNLSASGSQFLENEKITCYIEENGGFDFGLWYKAFEKTNLEEYDQIALVNDSCILFKSLNGFMDWSRSNKADLQGMTYSEAIAPHLQSYFLLINKNAIKPVTDFFKEHKILKNISDVIRTYEVGLSTYLVSLGFKIDAYMNRDGSQGEFSPYYTHVKEHLAQGIPLIKKKIFFSSYRKDELFTLARMGFDVNVNSYLKLMAESKGELILSLDTLAGSEKNRMGNFTRIRYEMTRILIDIYRKVKNARKSHN